MGKLPSEVWDERRKNLIEYLKSNPEASSTDVKNAGHGSALKKFYGYRINDVREELEIPKRFVWHLQNPRKLSNEDRARIVYYYNLRFTHEDLAEEFQVIMPTIARQLRMAREKGIYVIEDHTERFSKGVSVYFGSGNKETRNKFRKYVLSKIIRKAFVYSSIDEIAFQSEDGYCRLLDAVFSFGSEHPGSMRALEEFEDILISSRGRFSVHYRKELGKLVSARLTQRIERGEYTYSLSISEKEKTVGALEILSDREREVISGYYGLDSEPLKEEEIASSMGLTKRSIGRIRKRAINKLKYKSKLIDLFLTERRRRNLEQELGSGTYNENE